MEALGKQHLSWLAPSWKKILNPSNAFWKGELWWKSFSRTRLTNFCRIPAFPTHISLFSRKSFVHPRRACFLWTSHHSFVQLLEFVRKVSDRMVKITGGTLFILFGTLAVGRTFNRAQLSSNLKPWLVV